MRVLHGLLQPFQLWNDLFLAVGRWLAIVAIGLMVVAILVQVFFRYVLNNALPWPDEAARFMMLWMTGLIAPLGYRRGGFVAIDLLAAFLSQRAAALLSLFLLFIAGAVLAVAVVIGWSEVTGFGGSFASASLYVPLGGLCEPLGLATTPDSIWCRVPKSWMMMSLLVGVFMLLMVNIELILRSLITLLGGADILRPIPGADTELATE